MGSGSSSHSHLFPRAGTPALLVTQAKVSGYKPHMRWITSICSRVLFTASLF